MPEEEKKKAIAEFNFTKGILVATFSGIMSACFSFALDGGQPDRRGLARGRHHRHLDRPAQARAWCCWAASPPTSSGASLLNLKNRTGYQYFSSTLRNSPPGRSQETIIETALDAPAKRSWSTPPRPRPPAISNVPMLSNYLFSRAGRHDLVLPVLLLHDGRDADGQVRLRQLDAAHGQHHHLQHDVGLDLHEWKGSSKKAHRLIAAGIVTLILSTIIIGAGAGWTNLMAFVHHSL